MSPSARRSTLTAYPRAPQFPQAGSRYSEAELFWVAKHGIRRSGMSAYGFAFSDREIWELAEYVKRMKDLPPPVSGSRGPRQP